MRERVGEDFVVGCRFLADECIDGGNEVEDAAYFGVAFARAGMDFLSTSRGGKFDDAKQPAVGWAAYPYTGRSGYECMPQYHLRRSAARSGATSRRRAAIRAAIREAGLTTPIVCTGGVHNFEMAERLLADGVCDIVGAARQSLADPDWFRKISLGRGERSAALRVHQLLRRPRPEAQAGHLPALGQDRRQRARGAKDIRWQTAPDSARLDTVN